MPVKTLDLVNIVILVSPFFSGNQSHLILPLPTYRMLSTIGRDLIHPGAARPRDVFYNVLNICTYALLSEHINHELVTIYEPA